MGISLSACVCVCGDGGVYSVGQGLDKMGGFYGKVVGFPRSVVFSCYIIMYDPTCSIHANSPLSEVKLGLHGFTVCPNKLGQNTEFPTFPTVAA